MKWTPAFLAVCAGLAWPSPVKAASEKPWSIDYESSFEATNNLQQQQGGTSDLTWRNQLQFSYFPSADADNSALFQLQFLNQRYLFNPDYNSTYVLGTALASRRLVDSTFGYGGYQLIYKQANQGENITRTDSDIFAGGVQYHPFGSTRLVFHGYQADYLRAAVAQTGYIGHSVYATYREATTEAWLNSASLRSQLRLFDALGALEWRNYTVLESQYRLTPWWSLRAEIIAFNATGSRPESNFWAWNTGLFSHFTL